MKKTSIDRGYLMSILDYHPETGLMTWKVRKARRIHVGDVVTNTNNTGYLQARIDGVAHCIHRLAWLIYHGAHAESDIDHIDRNKSNNAISNLRLATRSQNIENTLRRSNNKSGFKGVFWHKASGRWHAAIQTKGVKTLLGSYKNPEEAYRAYCAAAAMVHTHNPAASHGEAFK